MKSLEEPLELAIEVLLTKDLGSGILGLLPLGWLGHGSNKLAGVDNLPEVGISN